MRKSESMNHTKPAEHTRDDSARYLQTAGSFWVDQPEQIASAGQFGHHHIAAINFLKAEIRSFTSFPPTLEARMFPATTFLLG